MMAKRRLEGKFVAVALHPAIDRTVEVERLEVGTVIRGRVLMVEAAGKGANAAHTLSNLGHEVTLVGFLNRRDREFYLSSFDGRRVRADFVTVKAATRENLTLVSRKQGADTHILTGRMRIGPDEAAQLGPRLTGRVGRGDWVLFAGSCPEGLRRKDYLGLMRACRARGGRVCVDTSGGALRAAVRLGPWLVKPNEEELEALTGQRVRTLREVPTAAREVLRASELVLVSLGAMGAVLVTRKGAWHARERGRVKVVHTVGCGDALLAGFVSAYAKGAGEAEALRFGVACGSACVRSPYACIRARGEVRKVLGKVAVEELRTTRRAWRCGGGSTGRARAKR